MRRRKLSVEPGKSVVPNEGSSDSETNDDPQTNDSSSENSLETITEPETEYFEPTERDILPGKFLLVEVRGGPRKKNSLSIRCHCAKCDQESRCLRIRGFGSKVCRWI
ncbi:unnamed protein product [Acanthoscelides obtectus]|uniref:Uncharacterized protein n=1 Tax=Acanthoscelides obtectus TaxID=200917 RepID=A0A9P0P134_ACAOB|nr:unnamed protein product [Acanthoscelides obtectus]CAK1657052.1 hypothetical protein AOBTE_LOCUS20088 [Acanthoscelides obtectus]